MYAGMRKYGVAATFDFPVYNPDGIDLDTDWSPVQADCELMKDGGTSTAITATAVDEGITYSIALTNTEMECARGVIKIQDATTKVILDIVLNFETYGDPSAQHAFDFDAATVDLGLWKGVVPNNLFSGRVDVDVGFMAADVITAVNITDGAFIAAKFAAGALDGKGDWAQPYFSGTSDAGGNFTSMIDTALTEAIETHSNNFIKFTSGALINQVFVISEFDAGADTLHFLPMATDSVGAGFTYELWHGTPAGVVGWTDTNASLRRLQQVALMGSDGLVQVTGNFLSPYFIGSTSGAGTTTTLIDTSMTEADDVHVGNWVIFKFGTLNNQARLITGWILSSNTLTFAPPVTAATGASASFELWPKAAIDVQSWVGDEFALNTPVGLNASQRIQTAVQEIQANAITAGSILAGALDGKGDWSQPYFTGTADAGGSSSTLVDTALTELDDVHNGNYIKFTSGAVINQTRLITAFDAGTDTLTFRAFASAGIGAGITYELWHSPPAGVVGWLSPDISGSQFEQVGLMGTNRLVPADTQAINSSTTAAIQLALGANTIENGVFEGTPSTTVLPTDLTETDPDIYIGRTILITGGAARGEATDILDYAANGDLTVTELANAPSSTDPFIII